MPTPSWGAQNIQHPSKPSRGRRQGQPGHASSTLPTLDMLPGTLQRAPSMASLASFSSVASSSYSASSAPRRPCKSAFIPSNWGKDLTRPESALRPAARTTIQGGCLIQKIVPPPARPSWFELAYGSKPRPVVRLLQPSVSAPVLLPRPSTASYVAVGSAKGSMAVVHQGVPRQPLDVANGSAPAR